MRVLVTGARGFVGRAVCARLASEGYELRRAVRKVLPDDDAAAHSFVEVGDVGATTDWMRAVDGAAAVVHLAARAHVLRDDARDPLAEYRRVNVGGTRSLVSAALAAGVRHVVFVSSAKVHGERSQHPFTETDAAHPRDPYAVSKLEAESALSAILAGSDVQWTILRPPLVYGAGVRANFLRMIRSVDRGVPLPLRSIGNRRSLIYLGNLVDVIHACMQQPHAARGTFLVSDGEDLSTPELVRRLAHALGRRERLLPAPVWLLRLAGAMTGRSATVGRLVDSLQLDSGALRRALSWTPPYSVEHGLAETADWYRREAGAAA